MRFCISCIAIWLSIATAAGQGGNDAGPKSTDAVAASQLYQYKATDQPRAGENIAQPCNYQASFPAGRRAVKAAWITYDRGPDITYFYFDPVVLDFAKQNHLAMVLAIQCPAIRTGEVGEMDMYPEHGLGRSLLSALAVLGKESGHPELADARLIVLGFSGTGAYFGHFVAFAADRVLAAILTNPGQNDPDNVDKIILNAKGIAVPELIVVGGHDTVGGTEKPYTFFKRNYALGSPSVYLVQNNIPHCCINDTRTFMLDWLREVIHARRPVKGKPLAQMNTHHGWYGSIQPYKNVNQDHWGLPLWNVCDAHLAVAQKDLPPQELPSGFFPTESLGRAWLAYVKQESHPKNSFPRPQQPDFGEPK